jgi:membrane-anchored mycosin MYCP
VGRRLALAVAAGVLLAFPVPAQAAPSGLPGPLPGCPPQVGIAAPAGTPWAQQALDFGSVWGFTRGAGVTVAVVDSGVDANPQFGHRVTEGPDLAGNEAGLAVPAGADCVGHGTAVASIIATAPMPGITFTGVAPAARILSIKVTDQDAISPAVLPEAIRDAVELGANVINLSLATTQPTPALRDAVDFALASNVVVVAAAGNDDADSGTGPFYPAAYPGVLSVGAVGQDGSLASFSDQHTPVTVTAPGVDITTAYPGTFPDSYNPDQNGTSFATAFVSGVAALVRADHRSWTQAQVVARIKATADGAAGPGTGNGMVNPVQAVTAVLPGGTGAAGTAGPHLAGAGTRAGKGAGSPVVITRASPPADRAARTLAAMVAAASFALVIIVISAAVTISAARRRSGTARPRRKEHYVRDHEPLPGPGTYPLAEKFPRQQGGSPRTVQVSQGNDQHV